jgi:hypothetical protein
LTVAGTGPIKVQSQLQLRAKPWVSDLRNVFNVVPRTIKGPFSTGCQMGLNRIGGEAATPEGRH